MRVFPVLLVLNDKPTLILNFFVHFSLDTVGYSDKEAAEEAVFFHKEDEKLLKKLLSKVRAQAEVHDQHSAAGARAVELSSLNEIVGDKLTDAQKEGKKTFISCILYYFEVLYIKFDST